MRSGRFSRKGVKDAWDLEEWIILFSSLTVLHVSLSDSCSIYRTAVPH